MDPRSAERERDRHLRRRMLSVLRTARSTSPTGRISGRFLAARAGDGLAADDRVQDDAHALELVRYLVDAGYVYEHKLTRRKTEPFGLQHVEYGATERAVQLLDEAIDPDPLIDDERIMGDDE